MFVKESPVIAISENTNQLKCRLNGTHYFINGLYTSDKYSVLVDF